MQRKGRVPFCERAHAIAREIFADLEHCGRRGTRLGGASERAGKQQITEPRRRVGRDDVQSLGLFVDVAVVERGQVRVHRARVFAVGDRRDEERAQLVSRGLGGGDDCGVIRETAPGERHRVGLERARQLQCAQQVRGPVRAGARLDLHCRSRRLRNVGRITYKELRLRGLAIPGSKATTGRT